MPFKDHILGLLLLTAASCVRSSRINNFQAYSNGLQDTIQSDGSGRLRNTEASSSQQDQVKVASRFWYAVRGEADHFREEHRDENGVVHGSYGYRTPTGIMRMVRYIADEKGFRAGISSNEPGVSSMEPSAVRLYKFPAPYQRSQMNRNRNPSSSFVSSPVRTHLGETNFGENTPLRHINSANVNALKYAPETVLIHGFRRDPINRRKTAPEGKTGPSTGTVPKNTFYTDMNTKDVDYGRQVIQNSEPKFHIRRTVPVLTTPSEIQFDSKRLSPWKRTSILKKSTGLTNLEDTTNTLTNSDEHFVQVASSNTISPSKENKQTITESSTKCENAFAPCASMSSEARFNVSAKETFTEPDSHAGNSNFQQEHLPHSYSGDEKLSAVHTALQGHRSKDNASLPQVVFAKKLLQLYDLNGIVPPHLLPKSISVVPYPKQSDAEVKAMLDQIAENRWKSQQSQKVHQKPWSNHDGIFRDIYRPEYSSALQYPKRPFIQLLSPLSVDIPDLPLPYTKPLGNGVTVPVKSQNESVMVNKHQHGGSQFISSAQESTPEDTTEEASKSTSSPEVKTGDNNSDLKQFVLKHFLLGRLTPVKGMKPDDSNNKVNNGEQHTTPSSADKMESTQKDTLNFPLNNIGKSVTAFTEFITRKNRVTSLDENSSIEEIKSKSHSFHSVPNSDVRCSKHPEDCLTRQDKIESKITAGHFVDDFRTNPMTLERKHVPNTKASPIPQKSVNIEFSDEIFAKPPRYPQTASALPQYGQSHSLPQPGRLDHRLFKITRPGRPVYDSRGQLVKPDAVPLHLHRFMPVRSSSPSNLGPFRFSIPRPVPPSSVVIPPKPPAVF